MPNNYQHGFDVIDPRTGKVVFSQGPMQTQQAQQQPVQQPQRGLLSNILMHLPFAQQIAGNAEAGNVSDFYKDQIKNGTYKGGSIITANQDGYAPKYLTTQEMDNQLYHPILENFVKPIANTASFLTPMNGVGGAAASAALNSFGSSDKTDAGGLLGDTVKGAAFGVGAYGIGKGISYLGGKLAKGAEKGLQKGFTPKFSDVGGVANAEELAANTKQIVDNLTPELKSQGYVFNQATRRGRDKAVSAAQDYLGGQFDVLTKPVAFTGEDASSIQNAILNGIGDQKRLLDNNLTDDIFSMIDTAAKKGSVADLKGVENQLGNALGSKIAPGTDLVDRSEIVRNARAAINKFIKEHPSLQDAKIQNIYDQYSVLSQVKPTLEKVAEKNATLNAPLVKGAGVNISPLTDTTIYGARKAAQGIGTVMNKAGNLATRYPVAMGILGSNIARQMGENPDQQSQDQGLPIGVDPAQYGYPEDQTVRWPNGQSAVGQGAAAMQGGGLMSMNGRNTQQNDPYARYDAAIQQRQNAFINLVQGGVKPAEAISVINGLFPEPKEPSLTQQQQKPTSVAERKVLGQADTGYQALERVKQAVAQDPSIIAKTRLPGILQSPEIRKVTNDIRVAAEAYGRMQSGGAINKEETKNFLGLISDTFADQSTALNKLRTLQGQFGIVLGYNPQYNYGLGGGMGTDTTSQQSSPFLSY